MLKALIVSLTLLTTPLKVDSPVVSNTILHMQQEGSCVVEALWHEARGESVEGIHAVLSVIYNRAKANNQSYCEVIKAKKQFSYRNKLKYNERAAIIPKNNKELRTQKYIYHFTYKVLTKKFVPNMRSDVLWYHTRAVKPHWGNKMQTVKVIGNHVFKRKKTNVKS